MPAYSLLFLDDDDSARGAVDFQAAGDPDAVSFVRSNNRGHACELWRERSLLRLWRRPAARADLVECAPVLPPQNLAVFVHGH